MSWINKVKSGISIKTGDGKDYFPEYVLTPKTTDFNIAEFNFPNVEGTLVKRGTVKGAKHNFEFIFQGENHLDQAYNFELSAKDNRPWVISHPFYGEIKVQPTSITYNPTGLNTSRITGEFIETISDVFPQKSTNPKEFIFIKTTEAQDDCYDEMIKKVVIDSKLKKILNAITKAIYDIFNVITKVQEEVGEYMNLFNSAIGFISSIETALNSAIRTVQSVASFPAKFTTDIKSKIDSFKNSFDQLKTIFTTINDKNTKVTYEFIGSSIVASAISVVSTVEANDFNTSKDVLYVAEQLILIYNEFVETVENNQNGTIGDEDAYIPNHDTLEALNYAINYAVANLLDIAMESKQERFIITEADTNAILLAHRVYGLDENDENLTKFIKQNNISLNEILQIKKYRKIVYYV